MSRLRALGVAGAAVGVALPLYGYREYQARRASNRLVIPTDFHLNQQPQIAALFGELGDEKTAAYRRLKNMSLTLYQFGTCPFCNKVRTFLDCFGLPYTVVEVDPFSKKEIAAHPYKKVPQLRVNDQVLLVDSKEIVSILGPVVGLRTTPAIEDWRTWSNEVLARYVVLRMNAGLSDAVANYQYIQAQDIPLSLKLKYLSAGAVMFLMAHKLVMGNLRKQGRKGLDVPAELEEELQQWMTKGVGAGPFNGGARPSMADTDVYGILQSVKGHKVYAELRTTSCAAPWIARMEAAVAARGAAPTAGP